MLDLTAISLFKVILKSSFSMHFNFLVLSRALQKVTYIAKKNVYPSNPDVFFSLVRCRELQTPCLPRRRLLLFNIVNLPSAPSLTLAHHLSLVTCHCICLIWINIGRISFVNVLQCFHTTVIFSCVSENDFNTIIIRNNWNHWNSNLQTFNRFWLGTSLIFWRCFDFNL